MITSYSYRNSKILFIILAFLSIGTIILSNLFGAIIYVAFFGLVSLISIFFISYRYPRYNILILLSCNYFVPLLIKAFMLYDVPFGIANEGLCALMLFTLILNKRISGIKTLPAVMLLIWMLYQLIELMNPYAFSRLAGFLSLRSLIPFICCFFIMYSSIDNKRDINLFFSGILILSMCAGLYCLYQEFVGLPFYDFRWATQDEDIYNLLFTWGRLRKFSFFFNPSEFGMLMGVTGVVALVIFFFAKEKKLKIISGTSGLICIWSMIYTGSRTAMIMVPVGLLFFAALTLHRKVLIGVGFFVVLGIIMMLRPASGAMYVMSTAFSGADDPSMNVRIKNRELIRYYIQSNPIGYGLGGTGFLGHKYSANTFIGTFATDSEYVRIAVEAGWIGLLLWCIILAVLFGYGVTLYFKTKDQEWKIILSSVIVFIFMIIVAQYAQELFVSQILAILLSSMLGVMAKIGTKIESGLKKNIEEDESR